MLTQKQHFSKAHRYNADINEHFMGLVRNNDITADELKKMIKRRPDIWGRFFHWISILSKDARTVHDSNY